MMTRSFKMLPTLAVLSVVVALACGNQANADNLYVGSPAGPSFTITYNLGTGGGNVTESGSGGDFQNSTLNGVALPYLYCTDLVHNITIPADYNNSTVATDGTQNGGTVNNASEIAYLLAANAATAQTDASHGDFTLMGNLQAAIWTVEYGSKLVSLSYTAGSAQGTTDLINAIPANTSGYSAVWLTPQISGKSNVVYQGLVTLASPEPSSFAIAGVGGLGLLVFMINARKIA